MEPKENDDLLKTMREHVAELLDNISDIGCVINRKAGTLLSDISNISHTDIPNLERIGLGMIKILKTLNVNLIDITNVLEKDLEGVNKNCSEKLFQELYSKTLEYKKSLFIVDTIGSNEITSKPITSLHKETQTEMHESATNTSNLQLKTESFEIKSDTESTTANINCEIGNSTTTDDLKSSKVINLGLIRTDTQDTNDYWVDTINRNSTVLDLEWCRGEGIKVTDEYLNQLKKEQNEDTEWDRKTEDLNLEFDRPLSPSDDTFIDGPSPKHDNESINSEPQAGDFLDTEDYKKPNEDETPQSNNPLTTEVNENMDSKDTENVDNTNSNSTEEREKSCDELSNLEEINSDHARLSSENKMPKVDDISKDKLSTDEQDSKITQNDIHLEASSDSSDKSPKHTESLVPPLQCSEASPLKDNCVDDNLLHPFEPIQDNQLSNSEVEQENTAAPSNSTANLEHTETRKSSVDVDNLSSLIENVSSSLKTSDLLNAAKSDCPLNTHPNEQIIENNQDKPFEHLDSSDEDNLNQMSPKTTYSQETVSLSIDLQENINSMENLSESTIADSDETDVGESLDNLENGNILNSSKSLNEPTPLLNNTEIENKNISDPVMLSENHYLFCNNQVDSTNRLLQADTNFNENTNIKIDTNEPVDTVLETSFSQETVIVGLDDNIEQTSEGNTPQTSCSQETAISSIEEDNINSQCESKIVDSDETDIDEDMNKLQSLQGTITEKSNEDTIIEKLTEKLTNSDEDSSSQSSNKSFVFEIKETPNDKECLSSTQKLESIEEDNESQSSVKSFVFGINENNIEENLEDVKGETDLLDANLTVDGDVSTGGMVVQQNTDEIKANSINFKAEIGDEDCHRRDDAEQSIEIISDSDDDVQLDVTMEEIISTGPTYGIENHNEQKELDGNENTDNRVEAMENVEENSAQEDYIKPTSQQMIGDELLELLREVTMPSVSPIRECSKTETKLDDKKNIKEADEIFRKLQEESTSDISDSDVSDYDVNLTGSEEEVLETNYKKEEVPEYNKLISAYDIKQCYVCVKKLELETDEVATGNRNLNDSIDRLCDINSILNKRKHGGLQEKHKPKKTRKSLESKKGTSSSDSFSDYSLSDSDSAHHNSTISTTLNVTVEQKLNDILANEICKIMNRHSSSESTDDDSDDSNKTSEMEKNGDKGKSVHNDGLRKKRKVSKEERRKKSWKNDPLLKEKLTSEDSSDSSTSDSDKSSARIKALKSKYEHDTDFHVATEESDSDSDSSNTRKRNKILLEEKLISPIKQNILISDSSSSDTDSDMELIIPKQETPQKDFVMGEEDDKTGPGSAQKGRRNIRALMSDESLAEATQRANKEEQERIERLEGRNKIKESLSQSFSQGIEEDMLVLDMDEATGDPLIMVDPKLLRRMKPHQKLGIQFMWDSCYESLNRLKVDDGSGCILAHCMGLGKTCQVLALLHTLFSYEETNTRHALVVCPLSTVNNWKKEVKITFKHFLDNKLNVVIIADKKELAQKYDIVKRWYLKKHSVLVLGYECFEGLTNETKLERVEPCVKQNMLEALIDPGPDLVICDEGHLLRNKKALKTLALNRIRTRRRIVLTGTPLQNNLLEYYYMVNFVKPNLLGTMKEFKTNFVNPITNGQYEDSTAEDIKLMMKRTHVLHKLLKKSVQRVEDTELKMYLPKIVDHAVFIQLHQVQVDLYNKFSQLVIRNGSNTNRKGFLSDFVIFQYICTHPHLLSVMENLRSKKIKERDLITNEQEDNPICNIEGWWKAIIPPDVMEKIEYGNKLMVLRSIIEECEEIGDKVLVFSQSLGELDVIEYFLQKEGTAKCSSWKKKIDYCRMDGTVSPTLRSTICDLFNDKNNTKLRLLLMSTKVGGLGLNLTAANRVLIMTVNWNPSYDIQSVFRAYRFGQKKKDSMEEKVYQRTVTKLAIAHRVIDKHQITRHYKSMDLQELYSCRPSADIERPILNVPEDKVLAKLILKLPCIFKHHEHQALLANRPEDNLNEQELNAAWDEFKLIKDTPPVPPPQQISLPKIAVPNGPTFSMGFDLSRPSTSTSSSRKTPGVKDNTDNLQQYFIPKPSEMSINDLTKKLRTSTARILKQIPTVPAKVKVISLDGAGETGMIPINGAAKIAMEQDPLYLPTSSNVSNKLYTEMLRQFTTPKLPASTTIVVVDDTPEKNTQISNHTKSTETSKDKAIVILDDESNKNVNNILENIPHLTFDFTSTPKRKRSKIDEKEQILKKMKTGFNHSSVNLAAINVDDDDRSMITDTASESGSLSNEVISNFGLSGVTIRKVNKTPNQNNSLVITLD